MRNFGKVAAMGSHGDMLARRSLVAGEMRTLPNGALLSTRAHMLIVSPKLDASILKDQSSDERNGEISSGSKSKRNSSGASSRQGPHGGSLHTRDVGDNNIRDMTKGSEFLYRENNDSKFRKSKFRKQHFKFANFKHH